MTLQLHSSVLLIKAFSVQCPSQPCCLDLSGSDKCERMFSNMVGGGVMQNNKRNFNL